MLKQLGLCLYLVLLACSCKIGIYVVSNTKIEKIRTLQHTDVVNNNQTPTPDIKPDSMKKSVADTLTKRVSIETFRLQPHHMEWNKEPSQTIQNDCKSIREILDEWTRGNLYHEMKEGLYSNIEEFESLHDNLKISDLTDVEEVTQYLQYLKDKRTIGLKPNEFGIANVKDEGGTTKDETKQPEQKGL